MEAVVRLLLPCVVRLSGAVIAVLLVPLIASAANRDVCATCSYTNISSALSAASSGDKIRVAAGTYTGALNYISLPSSNLTIIFEGGYDETFQSRNGETILSDTYFHIGPYYSGTVTIDGFTITGYSGTAIYYASTSGNLTVSNCHISNNAQSGIVIAPYYPLAGPPWVDYNLRASATYEISHNVIHGHDGWGGVALLLSVPDAYTVNATISDNVISNSVGVYGSGIRIHHSGNNGNYLIDRNESYENKQGLYFLRSGTSATVEISHNIFRDNEPVGLQIYDSASAFTAMSIHHNVIYNNDLWGIYHLNPGAATYLNNTLANQSRGIQLIGISGAPTIVNNIFYNHSYVGLFISGNESGYGGTNILPAAMRYNNFFNPGLPGNFLHTGLPPAYSYHWEGSGGAWGNFNQWSWSVGNFSEDPHFVDLEGGNFELGPESFCIDEGDPTVSYALEPMPNGSRVNVGAFGDTAAGESSPAPPTVDHVQALVDGDDLEIQFDTSTNVQALWVTLAYWDGVNYQPISSSSLSGDGYTVGYRTGRMHAGSGRVLRLIGAVPSFRDTGLTTTKIRVTVEHGVHSVSAESLPTLVVACSFSLASSDNLHDSNEAAGEVSLTASHSACPWTAVSNEAWINLTSVSSGTGNARIVYSLTPNTLFSPRTGTLTIGGQEFAIEQDGKTEQLLLHLGKLGTGSGSISSSLASVSCGRKCKNAKLQLDSGTKIKLRATPGPGSRFVRWIGGECSKSPTCRVTINGETRVQALFVKRGEAVVRYRVNGRGKVRLSPKGVSCGDGCAIYNTSEVDTVVVQAKPNSSSVFRKWSGDCGGKVSQCRLKLDGNKVIEARFVIKVSQPK